MSVRFWLLAGFLALVMLLGGSARADVQSLVLLRPAAVVACGIALAMMPAGAMRAHAPLLWFGAALFVLPLLHLLPLPPMLWTALPGRELVTDIDRAAGLAGTWRPLTLDPRATWNALFSLFAPLAALLLAIQLNAVERRRILLVLLSLGLASGLIGLLQVSSGRGSGLFLYNVTNAGSAVGLFANRNHQAVYLATLFPMLAVFGWAGLRTLDEARLRWTLAGAAGVVLLPLLIVTGSRTGFVLGLVGLAAMPFLFQRVSLEDVAARQRRQRSLLIPSLVGGVGVLFIALLTAMFARSGAISRLMASDQSNDVRFLVWGPIVRLIKEHLLLGTGIGSFETVFKMNETGELLRPTYLNHAHNDWLEVAMTAGLPGIALLAAALAWLAYRTIGAWRANGRQQDVAFSRLGGVILALLAAASITDYPLRVPSVMCLAIIAAVWVLGPLDRANEKAAQ